MSHAVLRKPRPARAAPRSAGKASGTILPPTDDLAAAMQAAFRQAAMQAAEQAHAAGLAVPVERDGTLTWIPPAAQS